MKFYIATKLENHAAHNRVRDALTFAGHEITYDWSIHGAVYRHGLDRVREVAQLETGGVLDADIVIVLWPGGRGTHVELGMALAAGKPVLISDVDGHHAATTETCAFYHHPLVRRGRSEDDIPALFHAPNTKGQP